MITGSEYSVDPKKYVQTSRLLSCLVVTGVFNFFRDYFICTRHLCAKVSKVHMKDVGRLFEPTNTDNITVQCVQCKFVNC